MDRHGQHICAIIENPLRPVAMVQIDIEDCDFTPRIGQRLGRNRRIVQITEPARHFGKGMVPWRAAKGIDRALPTL